MQERKNLPGVSKMRKKLTISEYSNTDFYDNKNLSETLGELKENLKEVIEMLFEEGEPELEGEFVGTQNIIVG